jgi:hypothetical protein
MRGAEIGPVTDRGVLGISRQKRSGIGTHRARPAQLQAGPVLPSRPQSSPVSLFSEEDLA